MSKRADRANAKQLCVFELGYIGNVNLRKVTRLLDSAQVIRAEVGDPSRNIGEPDVSDFIYSTSKLLTCFPPPQPNTIYLGVVDQPLTDEQFSESDAVNRMVISVSGLEEICARSGRTKEEYVVQTALAELVWLDLKLRNPS